MKYVSYVQKPFQKNEQVSFDYAFKLKRQFYCTKSKCIYV